MVLYSLGLSYMRLGLTITNTLAYDSMVENFTFQVGLNILDSVCQ
jgi:hypothetical protein